MKKRLLAIVLTLCLVLSLAACSSGGSSNSSQTQEPPPAGNNETPQESSNPEKGSSAPEGMETTPPEESGGGEETPEGAVSEDVLKNYGLTAEEFEALRVAISTQIQEEWTADEAYDSNWDGIAYWLTYGGAVGQMYLEEMMTDEKMDEYIEVCAGYAEDFDPLDPLFRERAMVLGHALNRWAADNGMSYDKWFGVWEGLEYEDSDSEFVKALFQSGN